MKNFLIMGVLNGTPDSFSDGGENLSPEAALKHTQKLLEDGADIIDIGGESTRPGSKAILLEEEWRRVEPLIKQALDLGAKVSIDTKKPQLMKRAAELGVHFVNNVDGVCDRETLRFLAERNVSYCAMHMHKTPQNMQNDPLDAEDALREVELFLRHSQTRLLECGFEKNRIYLDPGIGFGKTDRANLQLLSKTSEWSRRYNLLLGISRKSFLGRTLDIEDPKLRDAPSKTLEISLAMMGSKIIRTHDVKRLNTLRKLLR